MGANAERMRLVEELAANAWPAPVVQVVGGWRCRFGYGLSRRTDSVLPLDDAASGMDLSAMVREAEAFYRRWRAPARFQLSPAARPPDLDEILERRGYRHEALTLVWTAPLAEVLARIDGEAKPWNGLAVRMAPAPDDAWLELLAGLYRRSGTSYIEAARRNFERIGPACAYASIDADGGGKARALAIGRVVAEGRWAGIFSMGTRPEVRRRGAAHAVAAALVRWAAERGAHSLYLQVEADNPAARALYQRMGFTPSHAYHYRTLDA